MSHSTTNSPPEHTPAASPKQPAPDAGRCPTESEIDNAVADTFPASDPISLHLEMPPEKPGRDARCEE